MKTPCCDSNGIEMLAKPCDGIQQLWRCPACGTFWIEWPDGTLVNKPPWQETDTTKFDIEAVEAIWDACAPKNKTRMDKDER